MNEARITVHQVSLQACQLICKAHNDIVKNNLEVVNEVAIKRLHVVWVEAPQAVVPIDHIARPIEVVEVVRDDLCIAPVISSGTSKYLPLEGDN